MENAETPILPLIVMLAFSVFIIVSLWKVFEKAGHPGWAALVPIYNVIVLLNIAQKPVWWVVLFFIPLVGVVVAILVAISVANSFGKSSGFGIGLAFLPIVFYPMLAFGDAQYSGA